jgi:hypothetical protein
MLSSKPNLTSTYPLALPLYQWVFNPLSSDVHARKFLREKVEVLEITSNFDLGYVHWILNMMFLR